MKKRKKIVSLFLSALLIPIIPINPKAETSANSHWFFDDPCYNSDGELEYLDVYTDLSDRELTVPSEHNGIPVTQIDPINFIDFWLKENSVMDDDAVVLKVYLPDGVTPKPRELYDFSRDTSRMYFWPLLLDVEFIMSNGEILHYNNKLDDFYKLNRYASFYATEEDLEDPDYAKRKYNFEKSVGENGKAILKPIVIKDESDYWDYEVLEDENGEKYVKLLKYKGAVNEIKIPESISGIPVKSIGTKLFGEEDHRMYLHITIPDCVTEFEHDCFYGIWAGDIEYMNYYYTLITDYDPETEDYLLIKGFQTGLDYNEFIYECYNKGIYDLDEVDELFYQKLKQYYSSDDIDICDRIGDYEVKGAVGNKYGSVYSQYIVLPDSVKFLYSNTFGTNITKYLKLSKGLKILPSNLLNHSEDTPPEIYGLENISYVPRDLYINKHYDGNEDLYPADKLLPEGVRMNDPFNGFHINDDKGRTYRIKMDNKTFTYTAHLIYEPEDLGAPPEEFMGFPVSDERSDTLYAISSIVTIPEDTKELGLTDFRFEPADFPELIEPMSSSQYTTYEEAIKARLDYHPLNNLRQLNILSKDITIKDNTFKNCKLNDLEFKGNADLGSNSFSDTMIDSISFTGSKPSIRIRNGAFYRSSLKNIIFPEKVSDLAIETNAFSRIKAEEITLPDGTSNIASSSINNCSDLKKITINGSPKIGDSAFANCPKLESVTFTGHPVFGNTIFSSCNSLKNINIDCSTNDYCALIMSCPALETINGEDPFDEKGCPKKKYASFIEECVKQPYHNSITDKYAKYRVKKMIEEVITDDMTDMEKIKTIHDNICRMVTYDNDNMVDKKNHTDTSIFINDSSVCEGYARAFNLLLHEAGIESCYVRSSSHAWNIVNIGGHYFHIDTTWDDDDNVGTGINYNWFLKNDKEIKDDTDHNSWYIECPSALHDFQLSILPECSERMGDVNGDGKVDAVDASAVLTSYARASAGDKPTVDSVLSDVDFNGRTDAIDASAILTMYAVSSVDK